MKSAANLPAAGAALAALCLFLFAAPYLFPGEIALVGAERVLAGQIPYRDFWTMYAPGQFYLLAGLFALFGTNALVSVYAGTLLCAGAVGLSSRFMALATGRAGYALATAALFTGGFLATGYYYDISSYAPTIFCILVALNLLVQYFQGRGDRALIGAGLAIGVAALFKHDVGAYNAMAMLCGVLVYRLLPGDAGARRRWLRDPLVFALAAAVPVLPVVVALAVIAGYDAFWDTIWFPATIFGDVRGETYPSLLPTGLYDAWAVQMLRNWGHYARFALPFLVWVASLPAIAIVARGGDRKTAALGVTLAVAWLFHFFAAHVQVNTHIITQTLYSACLGLLLLNALTAGAPRRWVAPARGLALLIAGVWLTALAEPPVSDVLDRQGTPIVTLSLPTVSGLKLPRGRAEPLVALADYVRRRVPPGQPIYVGVRRHDIIIISRPQIYFTVDRPPATRYHELHSGVVDTAPVQAEMIRDLKAKDVKLIVLIDPFPDAMLDRVKRVIRSKQPQIGATALDAFIRANYTLARQFGKYAVWLRKPKAPAFQHATP